MSHHIPPTAPMAVSSTNSARPRAFLLPLFLVAACALAPDVNAATLTWSGSGPALTASTTATVSDGVFTLADNITGTGTNYILTVAGTTDTDVLKVTGNVSAFTGRFAVTSGTLQFAGSSGVDYSNATAIAVSGTGVLALADLATLSSHAGGVSLADSGKFDISGITSGPSATLTKITATTAAGTGTEIILGGKNLILSGTGTDTFAGIIRGTGNLTLSNKLTFTNVNAYTGLTTLETGASLALSGAGSIAASSGLYMSGTATFTIGGVSAEIASATIQGLQDDGVGSAKITLGNNTLIVTGGGFFSGGIGGAVGCGLTISGTESFSLYGTNGYQGLTTVNGSATLALSGGSVIPSSSGVKLEDAATFDVDGLEAIKALNGTSGTKVFLRGSSTTLTVGGTGTFAGSIDGTGALNTNSTTALTLSGVNTYTGITTITGGTLELTGSGSIAQSKMVSLIIGTFKVSTDTSIKGLRSEATNTTVSIAEGKTLNATGTTHVYTAPEDYGVFAGTISGDGGLTKSGTPDDFLTLTHVNSYTGETTITGGTLRLSGAGAVATSSGLTMTGGGGVFDISGIAVATTTIKNLNGNANGLIVLTGKTLIVSSTAEEPISGTFGGNLEKRGDVGVLTKAGNSTLTLTGLNLLSAVNVNDSGVLALSGYGTIGGADASLTMAKTAEFNIAQANYQEIVTNVQIGVLNGVVGNSIVLGANTLIVNHYVIDAPGTFAGVISGDGNFTVKGNYALTLSGVNTYKGVTSVGAVDGAGGILKLSGSGSIAKSSELVIYSDAGTFDVSGVSSSTTIQNLNMSGGTINLGNRTLEVTGSGSVVGSIEGEGGQLIKSSTGNLLLNGDFSYTGRTTVSGTAELELVGGSLALSSGLKLEGKAKFIADIRGANPVTTQINTFDGVTDTKVELRDETTLWVTGGGTFAGVINGTGGLTKSGIALTLSGANTYAGATTIAEGTLSLTGAGSIVDSSQVVFTAASTVFNLSGITAAGTSVKSLDGDINCTGTSIVLGAKTLEVNGASDSNFYGVIGGPGGSLVKSGGGQLLLTNTNSYTGGTTVKEASILKLRDNSVLETNGSIASSSGLTLEDTATFDITEITVTTTTVKNLNGASGTKIFLYDKILIVTGSGTFAGVIDSGVGGGGLTKTAAGTLTLSGVNTYTGLTSFTGANPNFAVLALSGNGSVAASSGVTLAAYGQLDIGAVNTGATIKNLTGAATSVIALGAKTLTVGGEGTFAGVINGTGGLTKARWEYVAATSKLTLTNANNAYTGLTSIEQGELALTGSGSIASSSGVVVDGTFDVSGVSSSTTIQNLSGAGIITLGAKTLNVTGSGVFTGYLGGADIGNSKLTKSGAKGSKLTLSGSSGGGQVRYVDVDSGELSISIPLKGVPNTNSGNTTVAVKDGGTLSGTGTITGVVTVAAGGTLSPGNSPGTLTVTGNVTLSAGAIFLIEGLGDTKGQYDNVTVTTGNFTFTNGTIITANLSGSEWSEEIELEIVTGHVVLSGGAVDTVIVNQPRGWELELFTERRQKV